MSQGFNLTCFFLSFQVLGAATSVAKHTSALCNACKAASAKTNNPAAKRQFVQAAKDVANNTANLVKNTKVCICLCSGFDALSFCVAFVLFYCLILLTFCRPSLAICLKRTGRHALRLPDR